MYYLIVNQPYLYLDMKFHQKKIQFGHWNLLYSIEYNYFYKMKKWVYYYALLINLIIIFTLKYDYETHEISFKTMYHGHIQHFISFTTILMLIFTGL